MVDFSVERYLSRFKRVRNSCCVALPEIEFMKLAMNGLEIELQKKFEGMEFEDFFELCYRATRYEWFLREENNRHTLFPKVPLC